MRLLPSRAAPPASPRRLTATPPCLATASRRPVAGTPPDCSGLPDPKGPCRRPTPAIRPPPPPSSPCRTSPPTRTPPPDQQRQPRRAAVDLLRPATIHHAVTRIRTPMPRSFRSRRPPASPWLSTVATGVVDYAMASCSSALNVARETSAPALTRSVASVDRCHVVRLGACLPPRLGRLAPPAQPAAAPPGLLHRMGPRPTKSSESVRSVRIRSITPIRLLHGFVLLPSGILGKMTISLDTTTIIVMLVVSFLSLCLATYHLFLKPPKLP